MFLLKYPNCWIVYFLCIESKSFILTAWTPKQETARLVEVLHPWLHQTWYQKWTVNKHHHQGKAIIFIFFLFWGKRINFLGVVEYIHNIQMIIFVFYIELSHMLNLSMVLFNLRFIHHRTDQDGLQISCITWKPPS